VKLRRTDGPPLVIGHRGAAAVAPENTLAALQAAVDAGADLVEFDIGPDLRLAHSASEVPAEQVSLDTALEFLREHGLGIHVDVKLPGYEAAVVDAIRRHGMEDRGVVSTAFAVTSRRPSSCRTSDFITALLRFRRSSSVRQISSPSVAVWT